MRNPSSYAQGPSWVDVQLHLQRENTTINKPIADSWKTKLSDRKQWCLELNLEMQKELVSKQSQVEERASLHSTLSHPRVLLIVSRSGFQGCSSFLRDSIL